MRWNNKRPILIAKQAGLNHNSNSLLGKGTCHEITFDQGYDPGGAGGDRAKGPLGQLWGRVRVLLRLRQQGRRSDRKPLSALHRREEGDCRDQRRIPRSLCAIIHYGQVKIHPVEWIFTENSLSGVNKVNFHSIKVKIQSERMHWWLSIENLPQKWCNLSMKGATWQSSSSVLRHQYFVSSDRRFKLTAFSSVPQNQ